MSIFAGWKKRLLGKPKTSDYRQFSIQQFVTQRDLPRFNYQMIRWMLLDPTVRLGLAMRSAPLAQAEFAFKEGDKWTPGIRADRPEVAEFVLRQLKRFWKHELHKMLDAQIWGWSAAEVTYRLHKGRVEINKTLSRWPGDVTALLGDGEIKGVKFNRIGSHGTVRLKMPQCYWHAYNPESESPYGVSALYGAYSSWADKQLNGGACDVRRLFMHKDAYGGMSIAYPAETEWLPGGSATPNRDIAREMVEQVKAGGVLTHPSEVDRETGKPLWEINYANIPANPVHILQYPKDLDVEILRGLEIPDDVLTSEGSGAWQGKQVPMQAFFTNADQWLAQVVKTLVSQVLEDLVMLNFGRAAEFAVETKPLAEQAMEQMGEGAQQPTQPIIQQLPQRMSLGDGNDAEMLVGAGVVQAAQLVEAGDKFLRRFDVSRATGNNGGIRSTDRLQSNGA